MKLKFTNKEHTHVTFNGESFGMSAYEDWESIGNGPTREAVKKFLEEGGVPEEPDPIDPNIEIQSKIDEIERTTLMNRGAREGWIEIIRKEAAIEGITDDSVIAQYNPFFKRLMEVDALVRELRSQFK